VTLLMNTTFSPGIVLGLVIVSLVVTTGGLISLLILLVRDWIRGQLW